MPSIGTSFFILGVVMVTAQAQITGLSNVTTNINDQNSSMTPLNVVTTGAPLSITATKSTSNIPSAVTNISISNFNISNTGITTLGTTQKGNETPTISATESPLTTPISTSTSKSASTSKSTSTSTAITPQKKKAAESNNTGIIIIILIIIIALGIAAACYCKKKRGTRYSVDITSRPDEVNIPLSPPEHELPSDTVPQNGLQTFEGTDANAKKPQEPEEKPLVQEEQKAETDKSVDPSAESAAPAPPAPPADSSEDKPKEDVVDQSPPATVEPTVDEKTDDEGIVSNKTSVESLKETNENNSNNADVTQKQDWKLTDIFWEVPLDSPV